jgi:(S)-3,5-dihydroxyphenylglycine transaminase
MLELYRRRRDAMLEGLERHLGPLRASGVDLDWNAPQGGFFITLRTPLRFTLDEMRHCAAEYGVICIPMCFFALVPEAYADTIRLSFSYVDEHRIDAGLAALVRYVKDRLALAANEGDCHAGH